MGDNIAPAAGANANAEAIDLRVIEQFAQSDMYFKIKEGNNMRFLMKAYADKLGVSVESLRFLYYGRLISDDDTLESLEMRHGDIIEVLREDWYDIRVSTKELIWKHAIELKPEDKSASVAAAKTEYIIVRACEVTGNDVHFFANQATTMGTMRKNYANYVGDISVDLVRFNINGRVLNDDDTVMRLGLKDGDIIEAEDLDYVRRMKLHQEKEEVNKVKKRARTIQKKELREKEEKQKQKEKNKEKNKKNKKNAKDDSKAVDGGERVPHSRM